MTTASNYMALGPVGDVQELPANGRKYKPGYEAGSYMEDRAASGKYRRDIVWDSKKKSCTISYEALQDVLLNRLEYLYELQTELVFDVMEKGVLNSYNVFMDLELPERLISVGDGIWNGATVILKEV